jgi:catechol 2,3-dioxygenase-like lactoylglutathione lyase family enzyme
MGSSRSNLVANQHVRLDRDEPFLRLQTVAIFVRDLDRSLQFCLGQLGFSLAFDARSNGGWVAVAPPDGSAALMLVAPKSGSDESKLIGQYTRVGFMAEDVHAKYEAWSKRGVHFRHPPETPAWGGTFTTFEDLDGNSFTLVGFDAVTRQIEEGRRALAETLEAKRRAAHEKEIARQVQARLFPQRKPVLRTLEYEGVCIPAHEVGGDYYDFLDLGSRRLGLVIGDISGKGIAAALLMANLQANLRSQCAIAGAEPQRFLRSVNQLFFENSADGGICHPLLR